MSRHASTRSRLFAGSNTIEVQGETYEVQFKRLQLCVELKDGETIYGDTVEAIRAKLQKLRRVRKADLAIEVVVATEGERYRGVPCEYRRAILRGYDSRRRVGLFTLDGATKESGLEIIALGKELTDAQIAEANRLRMAHDVAEKAHQQFMNNISKGHRAYYNSEQIVEEELARLDQAKGKSTNG